jgi:hypothetical protein
MSLPVKEFIDKSGVRVSIHEMAQPDDAPEKFYYICKDSIVFKMAQTIEQVNEFALMNKK